MKVVLAAGAVIAISRCSSTPEDVGNTARGEAKPTTVASIEAKQVAAEQEAPYVVEVGFDRLRSDLKADAREKVSSLYKSVATPDRIKLAQIITWADHEYPSESKKKLGKDQRELAKRRGETLEKYLKEQNPDLKVKLFNMAERPGKIADLLGSEDARVKESLERTGAAAKARRAIVLIVMKEGKS
jgi:hypothetical protein